MVSQNAGGAASGDFTLQSAVDSIGLANGGNHADGMGHTHDEGHSHGHSILGNGIQIGEAAVINLLLAANLIQFHDLNGFGIVKVGNRGIIESQMAILADAQ